MSKILICGDSWGCGEWNIDCTKTLHSGLEQYLKDAGHNVVNISRGGCSNLDSVARIKLWIERFGQVDSIFVFQTEYSRDFKHHSTESWNASSIEDLSSQWVENFYFRLSSLAQKHQCTINIIGGASDTVWFDNMDNDYPGCNIVCQSLTNLLINNDSRIADPVFSWYDSKTEPLLARVKTQLNTGKLLSVINLGFERESALKENPQWFYPDGKHPNRQGHQKLYNFLKEISIV
jgi:hypothetical protein